MIIINDMKLQQQLKGFESVWRRVSSSKNAKRTAEETGVKLMPKKDCRKGRGRYN